MLERLGYTALLAEDGAAGLACYRENASRISLVIVDMNMPGMGGLECVERLSTIDPDIRVVLSTGYSRDTFDLEHYRRNIRGFLQKPFVLQQLSQTLLEALAAEGQAQR